MTTATHLHFHAPVHLYFTAGNSLDAGLKQISAQLSNLKDQITMNNEQLAAQLQAMKDQNEKAKAEIVAKFTALEAAVAAAGQTTPDVDAALADLKTSIQGTDDLVPDAAVAG